MRKPSPFLLSVLLTTLLLGVLLLVPFVSTFLHQVELRTEDVRFRLRGAQNPGDAVVIVAVDDPGMERLGRWPWPRASLAQAVTTMAAAGARVIGIDILLSEPSRDEAATVLNHLQKRFMDLDVPRLGRSGLRFYRELVTLGKTTDHDAALASAIEQAGNVVVAAVFYDEQQHIAPPQVASPARQAFARSSLVRFRHAELRQRAIIQPAGALALPIPPIALAARSIGFVNFFPSADGTIRREHFVNVYDGDVYPSFDLEVARLALGVRREAVEFDYRGGITLGEARVVPADDGGSLLIDYYGGHRSFPTLSLADVIEGKVDPEHLRDRIVLVGTMATGLGDLWVAPFGAVYGIEKHAHVISNLLQGHYLLSFTPYRSIKTGSVSGVIIVLAVFWGLVVGFLAARLRPAWAVLATAVAVAVLWGAAVYLFVGQRLWLPVTIPTLAVAVNYVGVTAFRFFTEAREKIRIRGMFAQYVPARVVDRLIAQPDLMKLGGIKANISILFSDIEGFTTISESLAAEDLVLLINEYLTAMTDIVMAQGGIIDKYEGDAIMAEFGAPIWVENHADQAVTAAIAMQHQLAVMRAQWAKEGKPLLKARVGINTGDVILGNMGSERVFDYTVMGDAVNTASRLETANKDFGTYIMISAETRAQMSKEIPTRYLGGVIVKGKSVPTRIYEVLATNINNLTPAQQQGYDLYRKGILLYFERQWEEAIQSFHEALALLPEDPPSLFYIELCEFLQAHPPADDWNGVYTKEAMAG